MAEITQFSITKIENITDEKNSKYFTYIEVDFLDVDEKIVCQEDFVMDIRLTETIYIGSTLGDGTQPNPKPEDYVTQDIDVKSVILDNIRRYIIRNPSFESVVDNRSVFLASVATTDDPLNLKSKPGVSALIEVNISKTG